MTAARTLRDEMFRALRSIEAAAPDALCVSDVAEQVAADRAAAGKPALPADELFESCRVFLGRTFGFQTLAESEADIRARIAEARRAGPDAMRQLVAELRAEAAAKGAA